MASAQMPPNEGAVESAKRVTTVELIEGHAETGAALRCFGRIVWLSSQGLTFRGSDNPKT